MRNRRKTTKTPKRPPRHFSGLSWDALDPGQVFAQVSGTPGVWVLVHGPGLGLVRPLYLRVALGERGALACTGVFVGLSYGDGAPPVPPLGFPDGVEELQATDIHNIKLGDLLDRLSRSLVDGSKRSPAVEALVGKAPKIRRAKQHRPGRRGHSDEHYRSFAEAYQAKLPQNYKRSRIIGDLAVAYGVEGSTIYRWIDQARKRGFLDD